MKKKSIIGVVLFILCILCYSKEFFHWIYYPWKFDQNIHDVSKETIPVGTKSPSTVSQTLRDAFLSDDPFSIIQDEKQRNQVKGLVSLRDFMIYPVCAYYSSVLEYDYHCVKENLSKIIKYYHGENLSVKQAFYKIKTILKKYPPCNQTLSSVLDDSDWEITVTWTSVKDGKKSYSFQWEDNISPHSILPFNSRSTTSNFMVKLFTDDPYGFVSKEKLNQYISYVCSLHKMDFDLSRYNYEEIRSFDGYQSILIGFRKKEYVAPSYSTEDWLKLINISFYLSAKYGRPMQDIILHWKYPVEQFMQMECTDLDLIIEQIRKDQRIQIDREIAIEQWKAQEKAKDEEFEKRRAMIVSFGVIVFIVAFFIVRSIIFEINVHREHDKKTMQSVRETKIQLTERQKIFRCFLILDIIMLALAIIGYFDGWYYVFLRFVTCVTLAGFVLEKLSTWFKFILLLLVILYNPIVPVHLGDRGIWIIINLITMILLCCGAVAVYRKLKKQE